jgi:hypothetical protein
MIFFFHMIFSRGLTAYHCEPQYARIGNQDSTSHIDPIGLWWEDKVELGQVEALETIEAC